MSISQFIRPELMVLIPVVYLLGIALKKSPMRDYLIPFILGGSSILIATLYTFAMALLSGWQDVFMVLFTGITQGILAAGASTYFNQLLKQSKNGMAATNFIKNFQPPAADPLFIVDLVKKGNKVREGKVHSKTKIIIHDSGNYSKDADALAHASYLHNMAIVNNTYIGWHYTVDADRIVQHIPDNEIAYHAGDGVKESGGNMSGIGIEMCINDMPRFDEVLRNTAWLVAKLMSTYDFKLSDIKQHYDCSGKNCPYEVRRVSGKWDEFLETCHTEYEKAFAPPITEQYNRVQVGAWKSESAADAYAAKLRKIKIDGELVKAVVRNYEGFFRVQVGAWTYESLAKTFANKLQQFKIDGEPVKAAIKFY